MYSSFDVAKVILQLAERDGYTLRPMKLLKLVYITHGFYLAFKQKPLISSTIEAWKYGPVIPDLYHVIKRFGVSPVKLDTIELYSEKEVSDADRNIIEIVWNGYKSFSGPELSVKTHEPGSPWEKSFRRGVLYVPIENDTIKSYYEKYLSPSKEHQTTDAT